MSVEPSTNETDAGRLIESHLKLASKLIASIETITKDLGVVSPDLATGINARLNDLEVRLGAVHRWIKVVPVTSA